MVSPLAREILKAGVDDWVPLAAIEGFARRVVGGTDRDVRDSSLEAIKELVLDDLAEIGEVSDGGFFEWDDPLDDALSRIGKAWEVTEPNDWGFAVWVSATEAGSSKGQEFLTVDDTP